VDSAASSPDIIWVMKTDGACDRYGRERCTQGLYWGNLIERDHLEDLRVEDGIILKWFFRMGM